MFTLCPKDLQTSGPSGQCREVPTVPCPENRVVRSSLGHQLSIGKAHSEVRGGSAAVDQDHGRDEVEVKETGGEGNRQDGLRRLCASPTRTVCSPRYSELGSLPPGGRQGPPVPMASPFRRCAEDWSGLDLVKLTARWRSPETGATIWTDASSTGWGSLLDNKNSSRYGEPQRPAPSHRSAGAEGQGLGSVTVDRGTTPAGGQGDVGPHKDGQLGGSFLDQQAGLSQVSRSPESSFPAVGEGRPLGAGTESPPPSGSYQCHGRLPRSRSDCAVGVGNPPLGLQDSQTLVSRDEGGSHGHSDE